MEVSAEKTEYKPFDARGTKLLSLRVGDAALKEGRAPKLLGLAVQPHTRWSEHVMCMKEAPGTCPLLLRAVAAPERGPDREQLRAFHLASVQKKMCYGVASWWFDASVSDRERLERVRAQAARVAAGIPKAFDREDALCEARLKPVSGVPHRRALEYCLQLKVEGRRARKWRTASSGPNARTTPGLRRHSTCAASLVGPKKRTPRRRCGGPGAFAATSPRRAASKRTHQKKDRKVHTVWRAQRSSDFDYRVWARRSVEPGVSSGTGALVCPKDGRREKVVLGAGSLACSDRAECVAMEAEPNRLVNAIAVSKARRRGWQNS
ncbi:hypothetical protein ERJ75_001152900 [Trypanosoma vivax]|nr:hypothetical protein ERJ75_001152900 [Trypanosoma vivax]